MSKVARALVLAAFVAAAGGLIAADTPPPNAKKAAKAAAKARAKALAAAPTAQPDARDATAKAAPAPVTPLAPAALVATVDKLVAAKLAEAKLTPSAPATDAEFLRRASLDIAGVIPTATEARTFLADADPGKRAKLIDRLLADPRFGQHQADIWQAKLLPHVSDNRFVKRQPFTDWIAGRFNANTPWNEFTTQLLTATGPVDENPATTFFLMNRSADKLADAVGTHFMGMSLTCAQCHNHPFTDTKQVDYWGVAMFFSKVQPTPPRNPAAKANPNAPEPGVRELATMSRAKDFFPDSTKKVAPKFLDGDAPKLSAAEPYRPALAKWLTARDNPYFAKAFVNRAWAQLFGRGLVNPVDDIREDNPATHPELLDTLAAQFAATGYDVKGLYRTLASTAAYQRSSKPTDANKGDKTLVSHMAVKVLSPEQLFDSLKQVAPAAVPGNGAAVKGKAALAAAATKVGQVTPRDQFVSFFLAGSEMANAAEYEAGIPQALKLMNSKLLSNPALARGFDSPGRTTPQVLDEMGLAVYARHLTPAEVAKFAKHVSQAAAKGEGYSDVLWAMLNSSEFTLNR